MVEKVSLEVLIGSKEKSISQIVHEGALRTGFDGMLFGMKEVKDNLTAALFKAEFLASRNYVPIILLRGPSASGKSELIKGLKKLLYQGVREATTSEKLYTLSINDEQCPYKENAFNLFRSDLPFELPIEKKGVTFFSNGQEVCPECLNGLAEVASKRSLQKFFDGDERSLKEEKEGGKRLALQEVIPQFANIDLADPEFEEHFYSVVKNANRGILLISADKSKLSDISLSNYQFLINVYDNNLFDKNGKRIPLDMLVVIHSNERFIGDNNEDEDEESLPLRERLIEVKVRRNLSYSQEEKIYSPSKLPINRYFPNAFRYLSIMNILSRLSQSLVEDKTSLELDTLLDVLDMYDSGVLGKTNNFSKSIETFLMDVVTEEVDLNEKIKKLIVDNGSYVSGWSQGFSPRLMKDLLKVEANGDKRDINFFDIFTFYDESSSNSFTSPLGEVRNYLSERISADIRGNLEYGILALAMKYEEVPFDVYVKNLQEYLVSEKPEKILPKLGKLQDIINLPELREMTKKYVEYKQPENAKPVVELKGLLNFACRYGDTEFELLKDMQPYLEQLRDDKSKFYASLKEFSAKEFGYWDKCFEQAVDIYLNGAP